ncbi:unnamed protein product [Prorocentrum cordatum]|uniref:Uncharacterized protein n=1 Tax=Prorocentrum cordatum TaxID=2364126 RepID=A0ABN9QIK7_9DINO|nr:unnamed protein product [Polarella glacialis]
MAAALESRVAELEAELRKTLGAHEAAARKAVALAGTDATGEADDKLRGDLVGRPALEAAILAAGLAAERGVAIVPCVPTLGKQRRHAAAHVVSAAVTVIQKAGKAKLNAIQRGARHRLQRSARLGRCGGQPRHARELRYATAPAFLFAALLELVFILEGVSSNAADSAALGAQEVVDATLVLEDGVGSAPSARRALPLGGSVGELAPEPGAALDGPGTVVGDVDGGGVGEALEEVEEPQIETAATVEAAALEADAHCHALESEEIDDGVGDAKGVEVLERPLRGWPQDGLGEAAPDDAFDERAVVGGRRRLAMLQRHMRQTRAIADREQFEAQVAHVAQELEQAKAAKRARLAAKARLARSATRGR